MIKSTIIKQLDYIKDSLTLNTKITDATKDLYHEALRQYPDSLVKRVTKEICLKWDKRYLPPPIIISGLCDAHYASHNDKPDYIRQLKKEQAEYELRKNKHRIDVLDFIKRILNDKPLTEKQQQAYDLIVKYQDCVFDEDRDPKEELKDLKHPYAYSFTGLYMDFLEGNLAVITGNKKGDMFSGFDITKPKAYDEEHFIKEKERERSLKDERQRELL